MYILTTKNFVKNWPHKYLNGHLVSLIPLLIRVLNSIYLFRNMLSAIQKTQFVAKMA